MPASGAASGFPASQTARAPACLERGGGLGGALGIERVGGAQAGEAGIGGAEGGDDIPQGGEAVIHRGEDAAGLEQVPREAGACREGGVVAEIGEEDLRRGRSALGGIAQPLERLGEAMRHQRLAQQRAFRRRAGGGVTAGASTAILASPSSGNSEVPVIGSRRVATSFMRAARAASIVACHMPEASASTMPPSRSMARNSSQAASASLSVCSSTEPEPAAGSATRWRLDPPSARTACCGRAGGRNRPAGRAPR